MFRFKAAWLPAALLAAALSLGAFAQGTRAGEHGEDTEIPFDEAFVFFELNNTDGDLGIHAKIDGDAWKKLQIEDPDERVIFSVRGGGNLRQQGLTEIFFESAEPTFDEVSPEEFFARFPEGIYEVEGLTLEGEELESETEVTHTMPAPAVVFVNGQPMAEVCDDEDPDFDATEVTAPITISWEPVTMSHPDLGTFPPVGVEIANYEVVVEVDAEVNGEEFEATFGSFLPSNATEMTVSAEIIALGDTFKYEVLAREASYNQTAVESCFVLVED